MKQETRNRFYSYIKVPKGDGCWIFSQVGTHGYGLFQYQRKQFLAHRMAWRIFYGVWPSKWVLHHCDTRPCVRPDHLFEGTRQDNADDMAIKGKQGRLVKIPNEYVPRIRRLGGRVFSRVLANIFGVNKSQITKIQNGSQRRLV